MENLSTKHEYKPLLVPRRSEFTAWGLTLILTLVLILSSLEGRGKVGGVLLLVFLVLSSATMSIGNWIDRKTYLRIGEQAVSYFNGAREVSLPWKDISRVEIFPGKFGDKIIVSSAEKSFRFQALGKISMSEKVTGQVGFEQGTQILETILEKTGLDMADRKPAEGYEYYSRE
ncbi:MAG: hypothetical protein ABFS17_05150 [Chloroflexota bacterium]